MSKFEAVGRQHIIDQIEALESAQPGWLPMFYMTGSYERDIAAAGRLRKAYDVPRYATTDGHTVQFNVTTE